MKQELNKEEALKLLKQVADREESISDARRAATNIIFKISAEMLDDDDWVCYQLWKAINEISDAIWQRNREIGR